jgi:MoxR-like ATPase
MDFPFLVIATQNPIEQEGTYKLPEAQLDRFLMKIIIRYPDFDDEVTILDRFKNDVGRVNLENIAPILSSEEIRQIQEKAKNIHVEKQMIEYITKIVHETRNNRSVYLGGSPRASLALLRVAKIIAMMASRDFVIPDDVQYIAPHILNHRIILTPEAEISGITPNDVINQVIKDIEVPR